jgi:hypothetical protein
MSDHRLSSGPGPAPADRASFLRASSTDAFAYALLALAYEVTAVKIARYSEFTPVEAAALAVGIWGAMVALAWRLFSGGCYQQYRTQVGVPRRPGVVYMCVAEGWRWGRRRAWVARRRPALHVMGRSTWMPSGRPCGGMEARFAQYSMARYAQEYGNAL